MNAEKNLNEARNDGLIDANTDKTDTTEQLAAALKQVSVNTGVTTTVAVASDAESEPEKGEENEEQESKEFDWDLAIPDRSNITWLDIQKKRLREIPEFALKGLDSCEEVCLRYNLIKDMSPVKFLNPETLVELDLYNLVEIVRRNVSSRV